MSQPDEDRVLRLTAAERQQVDEALDRDAQVVPELADLVRQQRDRA